VRRYVAAARGSAIGVMAWLPGILTGPAIALGYRAFALALYDDPALLAKACDAQTERTLLALEAAAEAGADFLALGDDISDSTGPMMAPSMLRSLWLGRAQTVCARAGARNLPIMLHCCGHLAAVLPLAIEAGFDAIQPVAACNDLSAVLSAASRRIAVAGTIDVGLLLVRGKPGAVKRAVAHHWADYGPAGFVIGSNHSINDAVPAENLRALARAVAELRAGT
jgi:uroporphyrinogen decarboxylase